MIILDFSKQMDGVLPLLMLSFLTLKNKISRGFLSENHRKAGINAVNL